MFTACSTMYSRTRDWISSWYQQPCVVNHPDILRHILTFARDPRHSLVCKLWSETTNNWVYALTLEVYRGHKLMSQFTVSIPAGISQGDCKAEIQKIRSKVMKLAKAKENRPFFTQSATPNFAPLDLSPIMEKLAAADLHKFCKASSKEMQDLPPLDLKWIDAHQENLATVTLLSLNTCNISILPSQIGLLINLQQLYCAGNHLTMLPPQISKLIHLKNLYLPGNQLSSLPPEIGKLTNLESLNLSDNQLTTLPPQIFLCRRLTSLVLRRNQLKQIYFHLFAFHHELKKATLKALKNPNYGKNTFDSMPDRLESDKQIAITRACLENSFSKLQNSLCNQNQDQCNEAVDEIIMVSPTISRSFRDAVSQACRDYMKPDSNPDFASSAMNPQIKSFMLEAKRCGLTPLDFKPILKRMAESKKYDDFKSRMTWNSKCELDLYKYRFSVVPKEIWLLTDLNALYLQTNLLTALPPEISKLTNLTQLSLSDNYLEALPPEIGEVNNLMSLNLENNKLVNLPSEIFKLSRLKSLVVRYNRLEQSYFHLSQIHKLKNQVGFVPDDRYWRKQFNSAYNSIGTDNMIAIKRSCLENSFNKLETALTDQNQDLFARALKEVEMVDPALRQDLSAISVSEPGSFKKEAWLKDKNLLGD